MPVSESTAPNLFWGIVLKADKRYEQTVEECFHISKACIEPTLNNGKVCSVYLEQDNEEFILCNLSQKNLNESLDLNFTEGEKICFRVEGGGTVHLTGYLVPDEEDGPMFPMDDDIPSDVEDEEEEEEEEETPPKLVKKRKLENGDSPKAKSKKEKEIKQAEAMKKILEKEKKSKDSDEESDDEDSDDDDMDDSELQDGSSFFDTTNDSDEDEDSDEDDEDEDDEDDSEEESEDDSKTKTPDKKTPKKENNKTPNGKQKNESPKSLKKEAPKSNNAEKKLETPNQKKENKAETPATAKKDKKNKNLQNGATPNGTSTPAAQTPKNKDAKTPQANQAPNKTPKRQLKGGLMVEDLKVGNGPEAKAGKLVGMYYEGKLKSNNKQFDAQKQGKPFRFRLGRGEVIKGWDVGVEGMKVGGKRRLTVPANMGYGSQGAPPDIPPNATLVFEVECKMVN